MSKTKSNPTPIKLQPSKIKKEGLPRFSVGAFRWCDETFHDLHTGDEVKGEMWKMVGSANLGSIMFGGRKRIISKTTNPKTGQTNWKFERVYGAEALSDALSAIYPCSLDEANQLIKEARDRNISDPLLVLESDLYPTSREKFEELGLKNKWVVLQAYPSSDEMKKRLNVVLRRAGSPLRLKSGLKWKLAE